MYRIIGGDQREYGPVSAEDIRRWIAEGRLNAISLAKGENDASFKPLEQFPEFAASLSAHAAPPPLPAGAPPTSANTEIYTAEILAREPHLPVGLCLSRSWELL